MTKLQSILDRFDYSFPKELIAQKPASPRDSAKLLVYNKKKDTVSYDTFQNIIKYLPYGAVLVFNQTKVIPARIFVTKETGGKIEILYLGIEDKYIKVVANGKLKIGEKLKIIHKIKSDSRRNLYFTVVGQKENEFILKPSFPLTQTFSILEKYGQTPIPPYIKSSPLPEEKLRKEYQTVFAKTKGSVAAPTASLHFTKRLMGKIEESGFTVCFLTLHVGLGTFAKVTDKNLKEKKLHEEFFTIDSSTAMFLNTAKKEKRPIIAVGTTVVRTLESAADSYKELKKLSGNTDLFIQEDYKFKFVDGLITNFHVPRSSLMMLVSPLVGRENLLELYKKAIDQKFRLFSFGDAMLIV